MPALTACLFGAHALALCALLAAGLPWPLIAALVLLVLASAHASVHQLHWWRWVQWRADDSWWVGPAPDTLRRARLLPASVLTPWGCVLQLRCEGDGQRVSILLAHKPGADGEALRQIRVRLRTVGAARSVPTTASSRPL